MAVQCHLPHRGQRPWRPVVIVRVSASMAQAKRSWFYPRCWRLRRRHGGSEQRPEWTARPCEQRTSWLWNWVKRGLMEKWLEWMQWGRCFGGVLSRSDGELRCTDTRMAARVWPTSLTHSVSHSILPSGFLSLSSVSLINRRAAHQGENQHID